MDFEGHLYDGPTPVSKSRSGSQLGLGSLSLHTPKRARRQKMWSSPRVEETPDRATATTLSTRPSREDPRLMGVINRNGTDIVSSPTIARTPTSPSSPHSTLFKASQPKDTVPKPRRSSFPEKFVYLPGSSAYIDMTSIPKEMPRLTIWVIQQISHFFEHEDTTPLENRASGIRDRPVETPGTTSRASGPTARTLRTRSPPLQHAGPAIDSKRTGLRPRKPGKRVHYEDEVDDDFLEQQQSEDETVAESHLDQNPESQPGKASASNLGKDPEIYLSKARKANVDERPRTLSQKEIYRRNYAVEHDILPRFSLRGDAIRNTFQVDDDTLSENALNLGTVLVKILLSTVVSMTLEEKSLLIADFKKAVKATYNDQEALVEAFHRLAKVKFIQWSVISYLNKLGKPEVKEFGESEDVVEVEYVKQLPKKRGRGRPRKGDLQTEAELIGKIASPGEVTWKSLSVFKPYTTPYPNLTPAAEPAPATESSPTAASSKGKGKQVETLRTAEIAKHTPALFDRAQTLLNESQIDSLLALASGGSASEDEDDDAAVPVEQAFRDVEISSLLQRFTQEVAAARNHAGDIVTQEDWTLLPFIMTLADPFNVKTPEQRLAILRTDFEDFAARFVKPTVNTRMRADQAQALSGVYAFMAARLKSSPFLSIYDFEPRRDDGAGMMHKPGPSGGGRPSGASVRGSGRLSRGELALIKEDIQKQYDEERERQGKDSEGTGEEKVAKKEGA